MVFFFVIIVNYKFVTEGMRCNGCKKSATLNYLIKRVVLKKAIA